jgi:serine/threonine protein kinase
MLALKQLAAVEDPSTRQQVINELKVLCDVRCDHLVSLYDAFYLEGIIYLALEFMSAGSLEDVARKASRVGGAILGQVMVQVLQGLIYLHKEKHQLHRDLKPANILLANSGEVKLSDFGISRQLENTMAVAGTFCGTAQYMSPERIVGDGYSYPADVWCVGLIALECAIGAYPYAQSVCGSGYFDLVKAIVDGPLPTEAPALQAVIQAAQLPPELLDFVRQCLQKDAARRPTALQLMVRGRARARGGRPAARRRLGGPRGRAEARAPRSGVLAGADRAARPRPSPPRRRPSSRTTRLCKERWRSPTARQSSRAGCRDSAEARGRGGRGRGARAAGPAVGGGRMRRRGELRELAAACGRIRCAPPRRRGRWDARVVRAQPTTRTLQTRAASRAACSSWLLSSALADATSHRARARHSRSPFKSRKLQTFQI